MNLYHAIIHRRSYRGKFQERPIDDADLDRIIEAARWTPSPFNVQPWELVFIKDQKGKDILANMTEQAIMKQFRDTQFLDDNSQWMRLNEEEWTERGDGVLLTDHVNLPQLIRNAPEKFTQNILRVLLNYAKPLSFLGYIGLGKLPAQDIATQVRESPVLLLLTMNTRRQPPGEGATRWMWLSMGMLIQNILLAATSINIGVQFVSAPLESQKDRTQIQQHFNIPDYLEVITLLRMGYMKTEEGNSVRLESTEFVHYEKYTR
ncbi:nitroreductase family protein [Candidatus Poribacteria bacterium]|nr:nitroreductase family protein [Candidatus Poribacteria bacterium]MYB63807.1 nitroreductase family protein [Candidatus Poribacteria bacterium]MYI94933.1 nitroreductase family protein [Candidatus Poribacteria bacterium]